MRKHRISTILLFAVVTQWGEVAVLKTVGRDERSKGSNPFYGVINENEV